MLLLSYLWLAAAAVAQVPLGPVPMATAPPQGLPSSASAPPPSSPLVPTQILSPNTTAYIEGIRQRWGVAGISVAIVGSTQIGTTTAWGSELLSFGNATKTTKVTNQTLFAIGSNSKLFTALAIELLIANNTRVGKTTLSFGTKIKDILPEWKLQDKYASDNVDITDLLTMRSGMPRHDLSFGTEASEKVVANMRNLRPSTEIRQAWQYNNMHYVALSLIVSRLSGMSFVDYVQNNILTPVGLKNTYYNSITAAKTGLRSDAYAAKNINVTTCLTHSTLTAPDPSCFGTPESFGWWTTTDGIFLAGAGGISTNAEDMALWLKELLQPRVLPPSLVQDVGIGREAIGIPGFAGISEQTYGFGQYSYTYRGFHIIEHTGNVPGFTSVIQRVPDLGIGVVIMVNGESGVYQPIMYRILDDLLHLPPIDWEMLALGSLASQQGVRPPANATAPDPPFNRIPGKYANPGYGKLSFRPLPPSELATEKYQPLGNVAVNLAGPVFVAEVDKLFVNHLVLTHFDGPLFNISALAVHENVTTLVGTSIAVVTQKGIGLWGVWGQGPTVPMEPVVTKNVEQACEVWFAKD